MGWELKLFSWRCYFHKNQTKSIFIILYVLVIIIDPSWQSVHRERDKKLFSDSNFRVNYWLLLNYKVTVRVLVQDKGNSRHRGERDDMRHWLSLFVAVADVWIIYVTSERDNDNHKFILAGDQCLPAGNLKWRHAIWMGDERCWWMDGWHEVNGKGSGEEEHIKSK